MRSSDTRALESAPFLAGMIVCMTAAQVMFKLAGNDLAIYMGDVSSFGSNPWLWAGLLSSAAGMACWILTLRKLPLAAAYPWTALIYVITPLVSAVMFGEVLSARYLLGLACIVGGVLLTAGR
jgi:drug/metabolite transporter (DMT)-like permease